MMLNPVQRQALRLVDMASKVVSEGEPLDLTDLDLTLGDIVAMKEFLSTLRTSIDMVSKGLALYWETKYPYQAHETETTRFTVGRAKGKAAVDEDKLYGWMATLSAERLAKLVPVRSLKVGGMTPAERETFLDETPTSKTTSIRSQPIK
jgi:hypothetical protein